MGGLAEWQGVSLPVIVASEWTALSARAGLVELHRLFAALHAAQSALVSVMQPAFGRDTRAAMVRSTGMASVEARRAEFVTAVCEQVPGARAALEAGEVSAAHLVLLWPVREDPAAELLLEVAKMERVDVFARTVHRHRIETGAPGMKERQHRARTFRMSRTEDGGFVLHAVLTALDGEQVRAAVEQRCDERWRAAHPDRAESAGGHEDDPRDQRMADAFVDLLLGRDTGAAARTGVVVVVDESTMAAHTAAGDAVSHDDVVRLLHDARTDLYAAVRSSSGAILKFGRSRRFATPLMKLALIARDGGRCTWPGCELPWTRCDADHVVDWDRGGRTDLENLRLLCTVAHHPHRHERGREPDDPDPPD